MLSTVAIVSTAQYDNERYIEIQAKRTYLTWPWSDKERIVREPILGFRVLTLEYRHVIFLEQLKRYGMKYLFITCLHRAVAHKILSSGSTGSWTSSSHLSSVDFKNMCAVLPFLHTVLQTDASSMTGKIYRVYSSLVVSYLTVIDCSH
jgi:hypothetical protein